jgi:uncharacterized iron-regulated membrane protein
VKTLTKFKPVLLSIHLWGGLVAAVFFLVLAGTGCVMAFESEIDRFFHPPLLEVVPNGDAFVTKRDIAAYRGRTPASRDVQTCVASGWTSIPAKS